MTMETFVGTKVVKAEPSSRKGQAGYLVEYEDGYQSWSPMDTFEKAYAYNGTLNFGHALEMLKRGHRLQRYGWNGKGMFVYLVPPAKYPAQRGAAKAWAGEDAMIPYNAYLAIKNVDDTVSTWVPSINDVLADDWSVLLEG